MYKIKILKNKKPDIEKVDMICDKKICDSLDKWPMIRDNMNMADTTIICGRQGSGKTNLLINIVKKIYKKKFHKIYLFMPESSRHSMKEKLFDKLPPEQVFEELTFDSLNDIHDIMKQDALNGMRTLIIYDDVQRSLKHIEIVNKLKELIANQRHLNLVNVIKSIREIITNLIFFKMDKIQTEKIFNDMVELHKDKFDTIRDIVFDKPYEWCFISKIHQKIYKGFDEIIIEPDEDHDLEIAISK